MKKYSNAIFVVFLIIFAAGLWLFNSNITRVPLLSDDNFYFVKAKVVEVVEDNTVNKEVNGGSQNVKVENMRSKQHEWLSLRNLLQKGNECDRAAEQLWR